MRSTSTSREVLDSFRLPLILLDGRRRIAHANPPACGLLADGELIGESNGRLYCPHAQNDAELANALHEILTEHHGEPATQRRRLVLPLIRRSGQRVPAVVQAIRRATAGVPDPAVDRALIFLAHAVEPLADVAILQRLFGLTRAEARLAARIATGSSPGACARELSVKISTVRSQLNAIYRKTGTQGQAQLVALTLSLALL